MKLERRTIGADWKITGKWGGALVATEALGGLIMLGIGTATREPLLAVGGAAIAGLGPRVTRRATNYLIETKKTSVT